MSEKCPRLPRRGGEMSVVEQDRMLAEKRPEDAAPAAAVAIAGSGLITTLGHSADETWKRLLAGDSISNHSLIEKQWAGKSRVIGLATDAARAAIGEAGWSEYEMKSAGLVVGTSKGPIVDWITSGRPDSSGVGAVDDAVAARFAMKTSPRLTISAACASGLLALIRGALMIKAGEAQRVLVVAAEASVHEMFIASFRRLGVLAAAGERCRPFDRQRSGFLMSEAGAAVCLELADASEAGDLLIEKTAMGGDATHLIGGDDSATTLRAMLTDVIDGRAVDLIHAHGTGTAVNDAMELSAIDDCVTTVRGMPPAIYSHKGALGHSLGAAGLVSVVINRMIHKNGIIPPQLGDNLMAPTNVELNQQASRRTVRRSLVTAAGFGGAVGVVSLIGR
jgi:3-oxoacyl-[acyl-carrier-protein] synthase II